MISAKDFKKQLKGLKRDSEEIDKEYMELLERRDELKREKQTVIKTELELLEDLGVRKRDLKEHIRYQQLKEMHLQPEINYNSAKSRRKDKGYHAFTESEYMKAHQEYRHGGK